MTEIGQNPESVDHEPEGDMPAKVWRRGRVMVAGWIVGLILIILLGFVACQPRQGTIYLGICSAFLEQNVAYPESMRRVSVEQYPSSVRIYFTQIDSFGQFKLEMMECAFKNDPQKGLIMDRALYNRQDMDKAILDKFNVSIGSIVASEPDLTLPPTLPSEIENFKITE
jgi:hypothetical protein